VTGLGAPQPVEAVFLHAGRRLGGVGGVESQPSVNQHGAAGYAGRLDGANLKRTAGDDDNLLMDEREDFLRRLLERYESGQLAAPEYTERVGQLERATTVSDMAEIAEGTSEPVPGLDPVDMLLLARSAQSNRQPGAAESRPRYFVIGVLLFFFAVLLVVGLWLVSHARALHNSGNPGAAPAVSTLSTASYEAGPASPPSVRSSRR
jgi:hypothetical protein